MFFDGHEREDVMEYRERFLNEMKSLLPYFAKFFENGIIVPKEYQDNCTVGRSDQRLIIMITYNKSTFSTNNDCKNVWNLNGQSILQPKRQGKKIMVSNFPLP